jgi:uncharacterized membrane protein YoaK (UPF0700 family)
MRDTSITSGYPREAFYGLRHLLPGATALAATAGYVNSVVLGFFHVPVSHMTGAVSRIGLDMAEKEHGDIWAGTTIIIGYIVGAALAGLLVGAKHLTPSRRYGVALFLEGLLLGAATWLLIAGKRLGLPAAALACGLQNAMGSSYCGLQIRTTHITGMVTDIGQMIGHWIRHRWVDRRKFIFFCMMFLGFGFGGYVGALADQRYGPLALILPSVACILAGLGYGIFVHLNSEELLPDLPGRDRRQLR